MQDQEYAGFVFSSDKGRLPVDRICDLMAQTYWAHTRSRDRVEKAIANSLAFGVYDKGYLVGFARVVTDRATFYWLCDVIIDPAYRGRGLGKKLVEYITTCDELAGLRGALRTKNAQGLYARYGFAPDAERFMVKEWPN
jgi:GNAT superfamily N-acetyltransferase